MSGSRHLHADEKRLLQIALARKDGAPDPFAYVRIGMNVKRAQRIYEKWFRLGWWNCGIPLASGRLTEKGSDEARRYLSLPPRGHGSVFGA